MVSINNFLIINIFHYNNNKLYKIKLKALFIIISINYQNLRIEMLLIFAIFQRYFIAEITMETLKH